MINRPFYLRREVTQYVMFLMGRVGSTYLTHMLNSHPDILALSEELLDLKDPDAEAQLKWTRKFLTPPLIGRHRVRGFNTKPQDLEDLESFGVLLREKQCKILHMQRRNRVKTVISVLNGQRLYERTGMWGLFDKSIQIPPLTVDFERFESGLKHREIWDEKLRDYISKLRLPTLSMYYEDLCQDKDSFLERLLTFLGVRSWNVQADTLKITNDDLRKAIANFDQLRAKYVGTQYEVMFDEVL